MKKKIYIVDHIGIHSGMHYYNSSFKNYLEEIDGFEVEVLSNYSDERNPFFLNLYSSNKVLGSIYLVINYFRLLIKLIFSKKGHFILLSYGTIIDVIFMSMTLFSKRIIIDVHEVYALPLKNRYIIKILSFFYKSFATSVIFHSERSYDLLESIGYNKKKFYVPHFKYQFTKKCDIRELGEDVLKCISKEKINILFFGYVTYSKGIDILLGSLNLFPENKLDKINVIIAGKDFDGAINTVENKNINSIKQVLRYINDDELIYLFSNVHYVIFPYRKTSQSGVLEMAIHFKKPMLLTNLKYFNGVLKRYKSFGKSMNCDVQSISSTLIDVIDNHKKNYSDFYTLTDLALYEDKVDVDKFLTDIEGFIKY